ncbi:mandelate racemase/muconate lactonizing enzyme family protein [Devosia rhodophyticola]|uniref:Mandelate racemase/muconate lactonizing enzyme family protein n=1 Tax=Devosia rhodophyticola TaxID=3026423 RepID=A0ABY7YVI2_9HYPH|nr:mandelate racemase/muconate lactonizing enzyme family protein [Devosia rhodophyticola]WDR05269.1 mandelate racemase/muconate lactonizing enzyme family protein [Devosia rhodophyticola]
MTRFARVETFVFRYPIETPVRTALGVMYDRPMVLVAVTDRNGMTGFGEIWCNYSAVSPEYRARIVDQILAPLLLASKLETPAEISEFLRQKTHLMALQSGEQGPFSAAIAGLDIALNDLTARQADMPLCAMLGEFREHVPIYASGINPERPEEVVSAFARLGYGAFKVKVGFGQELDLRNLSAVRALGDDFVLAIDANQNWDLPTATSMMNLTAEFDLAWVEEPMAADRPTGDWDALAAATNQKLAAGENLTSWELLEAAIAKGILSIIQPDAAKWGGISGCLAVARSAQQHGRQYYPHYLGGGIGLIASAHLLAAAGGDGLLEVDANPNPLRSAFADQFLQEPHRGMQLTNRPGLGFEPDLEPFSSYSTHYRSVELN